MRVEYLKPPPLNVDAIVQTAEVELLAMAEAIKREQWNIAARHGDLAVRIVKILGIHAERVANPIRVEYPAADHCINPSCERGRHSGNC